MKKKKNAKSKKPKPSAKAKKNKVQTGRGVQKTIKKLSKKVKETIKERKGKVSEKNYSGDALTYLRKYKALAKARSVKKEGSVSVGKKFNIPKNSKLYRDIELAAKSKGQSVEQLIKENQAAVEQYYRKGSVTVPRTIDYAIEDINNMCKKCKLFVNEKPMDKQEARLELQTLQSNLFAYTDIFMLTIEVTYYFNGDLEMEFPTTDMYEDLIKEFDDGEMSREEMDAAFSEFLDQFGTVVSFKSNVA